jgi:hypothetical protein
LYNRAGGYGRFQFYTCSWPPGAGGCYDVEKWLAGTVFFDSVKIEAASIPGTVPLPAGLPLLAGALALLGGAARRRRAAQV